MLFLGLDLGKEADPSALAMLRVVYPPQPAWVEPSQYWGEKPQPPPPPEPQLHMGWLQRYPLKTRYTRVVELLCQQINEPPIANEDGFEVIYDATGVGNPVGEMLENARIIDYVSRKPKRIPLCPVTITGENEPKVDANGWHVPKRDLVDGLRVSLERRQLYIADSVPDVNTFTNELYKFRVKVKARSIHDSYEAREGEHDDLVLAAAIAVWRARRWLGQSPRRKKLPPGPGRRFSEHKENYGDTVERWTRGDVASGRGSRGGRRM